jgi:hypothetical protein
LPNSVSGSWSFQDRIPNLEVGNGAPAKAPH